VTGFTLCQTKDGNDITVPNVNLSLNLVLICFSGFGFGLDISNSPPS
jgi:hypothetical protein